MNFKSKQNNPFSTVTAGFSVPVFSVNNNHIAVSQTPAEVVTNPINPQVPQNDVFTPTNKPAEKKTFGKKVLYSMLGIGIAVLALTKGLSSGTAGKISRFGDWLENKSLRFASKNKTAENIETMVVSCAKRTKRFFSLSNAIANITAIKDTIVKKFTTWDFLNFGKSDGPSKLSVFFKKYLPIQKCCDFITRNVLKITQKAVDTRYKTTGVLIDSIEAQLKNMLNNPKIPKERAQKIANMVNEIIPLYRQGFSKSVRDARLEKIQSGLSDLDKRVCDALISPFKKDAPKGTFKEVYSSYITEKLSKPVHDAHLSAIDKAKIALSNDIYDVSTRMRDIGNRIKHHFNPKDKSCRLMFGELLDHFEEFKKYSRSNQADLRQQVQDKIVGLLNRIEQSYSNFSVPGKKDTIITYSQKEIEEVRGLVSSMKEAMTTSAEKGLLQKILTESKEVFSEKECRNLKSMISRFNQALNSANDLEGNNMFNKIAESKLGSIVTDMAGLGFAAGGGVYAVSKGKEKDEKIGATLKVGVPLFGTICAYFYSAAKAYSGTTNLLFSAVTAYLLNKVGTSIYDYYKKRFVENKSVKEIATDSYNNATTT